jgi:twitching motility protein PilT
MAQTERISYKTLALDLLTRFRDLNASDLHLVPGRPPHFRVNGRLVPDGPFLPPGAVKTFLTQITDGDILATLLDREEIDLSSSFRISEDEEIRFRLNAALAGKMPFATLRRLLEIENTPFELGLPEEFVSLCESHSHGVIFVTGTTGSGKSTTLASILAYLLERKPFRVITLEDPVEYVIPPGQGVISQREIGQDTRSFATALRAAMRQDPDVILVGEVRDAETAEALLAAAETGHLVFATLHVGAASLVSDRIAGMFSSVEEGVAVKGRLANVLAGVLTQALVPSSRGRSLAWEFLAVGSEERELLHDDRQALLRERMRESRTRLADSLARLVAWGLCEEHVAKAYCNYHDEWDPQYMEFLQGAPPPEPDPPPSVSVEREDRLEEEILYGCL